MMSFLSPILSNTICFSLIQMVETRLFCFFSKKGVAAQKEAGTLWYAGCSLQLKTTSSQVRPSSGKKELNLAHLNGKNDRSLAGVFKRLFLLDLFKVIFYFVRW